MTRTAAPVTISSALKVCREAVHARRSRSDLVARIIKGREISGRDGLLMFIRRIHAGSIYALVSAKPRFPVSASVPRST